MHMVTRYFHFLYFHPIVFTYILDQLFPPFLYLFVLKYLLSIFWTPYQMIYRIVDRMTRPPQSHALCYTTSRKGLCGLGRLPVSLITLCVRHVFIPVASHGGFYKDFAKNVKHLIERLFETDEWVNVGGGYSAVESSLKLSGWSRSRRVIVIRRYIAGDILLEQKTGEKQLNMAFIETEGRIGKYEYAVLVTSLPDEILTIARHYRDRADCENSFDELKNQWGWGGYTTKDLKRCRFISRMVALVYNWWSLFVRLANPEKHHEAITSRPLLLHAVAKQTKHGGQTFLTITSHHAKSEKIEGALRKLSRFLTQVKVAAEQLSMSDRIKFIARYAFRKMIGYSAGNPVNLLCQSG